VEGGVLKDAYTHISFVSCAREVVGVRIYPLGEQKRDWGVSVAEMVILKTWCRFALQCVACLEKCLECWSDSRGVAGLFCSYFGGVVVGYSSKKPPNSSWSWRIGQVEAVGIWLRESTAALGVPR